MRKTEIPESVKIVGSNIKRVIEEKNLKVRHVAHDSDLDIEALRRYMAGKQIMGIDKLARISKALNVDISDLFQNIQL
jgi:transcriptional regulator with XRE-family HTH domain